MTQQYYESTGPGDSPQGTPPAPTATIVRDVNGTLVTGYTTTDGGFMSTDGTVYIPAGGAPEYGITDPTTQSFLPGGSVRVIDGAKVYGTVLDNGDFISEDGTILQLRSGFVEHGRTDAAGNFTAYTTVDGKQVWGNYGDDGSFMSTDGTLYIPAGGKPEYGITDPTTGNFLPNGSTRVIGGATVYGAVLDNGDFISEDGTILQLPNGFVENGKTDAQGYFTARATVDGKEVWGNYGTDGSFMSTDGTIYIPPGGKPEYGITDPTTGTFLPAGQTRVIGGVTVYGTVLDNGDFLSEDGTILQLPSGFVEHGSTNAQGYFIAQMQIDGKQVSGNYGDDGSFMSSDGTIYVPAGGAPEYGVTDPATNSFLPGGTTFTEPNGTILYGYEDDGAFWSYDGKAIVINNTVITGSLQKGDGIFTGDNGNSYFVGANGIVQVTPQSDGSYKLPDGSVVMTPNSWKTDLALFQEAQDQISTYIQNISDDYSTIQEQYSLIESLWTSPAGTSFADTAAAVDLTMSNLNTVLDSITTAMQTSYNNYYAAEQQAIAEFQKYSGT